MLFSIRIPSFLGWAADTALYGIIVAEDGEGCFKLLLRFFDDFFQIFLFRFTEFPVILPAPFHSNT